MEHLTFRCKSQNKGASERDWGVGLGWRDGVSERESWMKRGEIERNIHVIHVANSSNKNYLS